VEPSVAYDNLETYYPFLKQKLYSIMELPVNPNNLEK
jgi:hypothetical protein